MRPRSSTDRWTRRTRCAESPAPPCPGLPICAGSTGSIAFMHSARRGHYRPHQLAVLEDLTGRAAMAYDNARLYAERARVAGTLRRSLMPPDLPAIPGIELASFFRPMGAGDEVGGDF